MTRISVVHFSTSTSACSGSLASFGAQAGSLPRGESLLVPLLDLDVAALQLEGAGEGAAGAHAGEVLGGVDGEDLAEHLRQDGREAADVQVRRVDAHHHEAQPVPPVRAARQVREAEEAPLVVVLVLRHRWRRHQLPHQSSRGPPVGLDQRCFFAGAFGVPQRAVDYVERIPQFVEIYSAQLGIVRLKLNDGWWVDDTSVPLAETARAGCNRLLPNNESVVEVTAGRLEVALL